MFSLCLSFYYCDNFAFWFLPAPLIVAADLMDLDLNSKKNNGMGEVRLLNKKAKLSQ